MLRRTEISDSPVFIWAMRLLIVGVLALIVGYVVYGRQWRDPPQNVHFLYSDGGQYLLWTQASEANGANVLWYTEYEDMQCQIDNVNRMVAQASGTPTMQQDCTRQEEHTLVHVYTMKGSTYKIKIPENLWGQPLYIAELQHDGSLNEKLFGGRRSGPYTP